MNKKVNLFNTMELQVILKNLLINDKTAGLHRLIPNFQVRYYISKVLHYTFKDPSKFRVDLPTLNLAELLK